MSENILKKIIEKKKNRLIDLKKKRPLESLLQHPTDSMLHYNFKQAIEQNIAEDKISIIAESKKASPSAGIIIENYDPVEIAKIYQKNKATCLSILTEEDFFLGNLSHIYKIKLNSNPMENSGVTLPNSIPVEALTTPSTSKATPDVASFHIPTSPVLNCINIPLLLDAGIELPELI